MKRYVFSEHGDDARPGSQAVISGRNNVSGSEPALVNPFTGSNDDDIVSQKSQRTSSNIGGQVA